jgi:hypothetical protein
MVFRTHLIIMEISYENGKASLRLITYDGKVEVYLRHVYVSHTSALA